MHNKKVLALLTAMPKLKGESKETDEKSLEDKEKSEMADADAEKKEKDLKASYKRRIRT